ncbi:unnamed protein product [Caenorhabditis bovis]|uniref:glucuronosyltransferase n=1 Tax=Caenorhabditis bovis TaxID=2654633 RepID=A0A8S1F5T0_9PELO|nr:unnamed protein product [Caenorhabditis bovis]
MLVVLLFALFVFSCHSLNVLLFVPTLSHSHVAFNTKIAEILKDDGHQVVMLLPKIDDSVSGNSSQFEMLHWNVGIPPGHLRKVLWNNPGPYEDASPLNPRIFVKLLKVSKSFVEACEYMIYDNHTLNFLKSLHFDVGLVEQYDSCGFGIFKLLGINSTVWLSATGLYRPQATSMGVNLPYSYVPELFAHFSDEMSFRQKVENVLIGVVTSFVQTNIVQSFQESAFRASGLTEALSSLPEKSSSVLVNSMPLLDFAMPISHQFSNIAGFTVEKNKENLENYWERIAANSTNGFVLVSFGGIARTIDMPRAMLDILFDSFSTFSHIKFIMKYEGEAGDHQIPDNVILTPWIPQLALMGHPNYLAIITHGGWSSILETIIHLRPMILMPLFADHAKNSKVAESKGIAIVLDKLQLSRRKVKNAIGRIILDSSFRKNCEKFSRMLLDQPVGHSNIVAWRIRQAAKRTRKKFARHLKPKRETTSNYFMGFFVCTIAIFKFYKS